jgi:S1-C subfamily serine protease
MLKLKDKILNFFLILIIGGLGGVLADQFLLPYLATVPPFSKIKFIQQARDGTTIINPTEKIIITENTALEQAIDKISPCLVAIHSYQNKRLISQGTGFIVTSDGLVMTAADLIPVKADQYLVFRDNRSLTAQVVKRDLENNLALLKIEESNLPVVSLVDLEDLHLGQRIILVGLERVKDNLNLFVNLGIIRSVNKEILKINLTEENSLANGGPLINVKGEVIGLNLIDRQGLIKTIPANKIKEFLSL